MQSGYLHNVPAASSTENGPSHDPVLPNSLPSGHLHFLIKASLVVVSVMILACGCYVMLTEKSPMCTFSGVYFILVAILIIAIEAPVHSQWTIKLNDKLRFLHDRPKWQQSIFFAVLSIVPIAVCRWMWAILGSVLLMVCAVGNGILAIIENRKNSEKRPSMAPLAVENEAHF